MCIERFGGLDILVNNAGKGPVHVERAAQTSSMKFWQTDPRAWADVITTNVTGTYFMSHAAAPHLIAAGWGRIVNVTTSLSTMQRHMNSPYGVSKVAIEAETLIWSKDLEGTGVTVNTVLPGGATNTDFLSDMGRQAAQKTGRIVLEPEVIVSPVLWLASDEAAHISGQRFVGKLWDDALPLADAAQQAREPQVIREADDGR